MRGGRTGTDAPLAVVLGDRGIEVVRALAMVGARCAVVAGPGDPARWSRHVRPFLDWDWMQPLEQQDSALADRLVRFGLAQDERPVLVCCTDQPMVFVSRHRGLLERAFRFVVPDADLVEALVDKASFVDLALARRLPVPPGVVLPTDRDAPPAEAELLTFPIVVKPTVRDGSWLRAVGGGAKAVRLDSPAQLRGMWPRIRGLTGPALAQQYVEGPESRVLSYHTYVDHDGVVAGEFTGRKIRTVPAEYGHTSALTVADDPDVLARGREVARAVGLRGVAKIDFKRAPDGRLFLLEVNARCTLWAHPGARAGVNLPGLVYADLTGRPRPPVAPVRADVDWVHPKDVRAAGAAGVPLWTWLRWASTCRAKAVWCWNDPLPLVGAALHRILPARHRRADRPTAVG